MLYLLPRIELLFFVAMYKYALTFCFLWHSIECYAQCDPTYANVIGSILEDEKGYSLTGSSDGQFVYVGGIKGDSAVILKVHVNGQLEWTRTFDIVPGKKAHIHSIFLDVDGMIGIAGTAGTQTDGGTVFAMRYNPTINTILWANEYVSTSTNFCQGMIEKVTDGNYLMTNNPSSPNVAELLELDKTTGEIVTDFSHHYDMGSSESFYDFAWNNGHLYASGRFSDGGSVAEMRNILAKINPENGTIDWMKLGHRTADISARLYGFDLVIVDNFVYSLYAGDGDGSSIDDTKVFLQKSDISGNLLWIKQYDFPGDNDWIDEMIYSDEGLVILGRNRVAPSDMYLFKTDTSGGIVWSYTYDFFANDNATPIGSVQSQLIEAGNNLFFTAYTQASGPADMILVKTGLDGRISDTCLSMTSFLPQVSLVENPVFYLKQPTVYSYIPQRNALAVPAIHSASLSSRSLCTTSNIADTTLIISICEGDEYEGYTETGIYIDTFLNIIGCDSIRTLILNVRNLILDTVNAEICPGQDIEGYGDTGIYLDTFTTVYGCDSLRILILEVSLPVLNEEFDLCTGSSYMGYISDTMYTDTLLGALEECDTIRNISLHFLEPIQAVFEVTICEGENYDTYTRTGTYIDTLKTPEGCDSMRTVFLSVENRSLVSIETTICDERAGKYKQPGIYLDTLTSINGCDSIRKLQLRSTTHYIPNVFSPNDDGHNDLFTLFPSLFQDIHVVYFAIFDRMGNMAYETTDRNISWNGKGKNGQVYNPGVFVYILKYWCNHDEIIETGNITLIR